MSLNQKTRKLKGGKKMTQTVAQETEAQAAQTQDLLTATLKQGQVKVEFDEARARELLDYIISRPLLVINHDKVIERARNFVSNWFIQEAARSYALISPEVFDRKRKITQNNKLEIQLLFRVPIQEMDEKEHVVLDIDGGYSHGRYQVKAEIPELTYEARDAYIKTLSFNADLAKRAYADPLIQKILATDRRIKTPYEAEFSVIWAPEKVEVDKVTPVPRDPALVMSYSQHAHFRVYQWDAPGEYPLEAMLKEFITSFPQATLKKE